MAINLDALSTAMRGNAQASTPAPKVVPEPAAAAAAAAVQQQKPKAQPPEPQDLEAVVEQLNRMMRRMDNSLQFEVDSATGRTVVRVLDSNTKEILRQFPSEEVLAIAHALENAKGVLLSDLA